MTKPSSQASAPPRRGAPLTARLRQEVRETIERPGRIRSLAKPSMLQAFFSSIRDSGRVGMDRGPGATERSGRFVSRRYDSYGQYVSHQQAKLGVLDLEQYDVKYRELLAARLRAAGHVRPEARVLCLAARLGTEVRAFHDIGCFAVGIDLNPGDANRHVLHGDFHDVQFPDGSVDVVFTNSIDHALEPSKLLGEVRRLLVPGGLFVVEASLGANEGFTPQDYEAFYWDTVQDLVELIESEGFERVSSSNYEEPWAGVHSTFLRR